MDVAIKVLAVVAGFVAAFASYPFFAQYVFALLAFAGAVATGVIAGVLVERLLSYVLSGRPVR